MTEITTKETRNSEWKKLLLLAFVGLPIVMFGVIVTYGLIVRLLQVFLIGLPGA
ncbi:nitrate/trimethylamine N-oxide reductase NapE/TorE [Iodobacter ciconiae]|uniref:Nitrate/trimethylamine N-oxide reductase NapE/TorE n=1 Tax=Iodobacter ciconiae TaxID=2496266 RepID=A0A3S8ZWI5_9NEIS|nr:nitrate/trimethylamine N-oxide reductase NapE/TorE [Iodobacter ciconiae]AZN37785.1 nitrate/trimethylamine N-oxide reductase NapE/TorE [Iodobacter ciconiae]